MTFTKYLRGFLWWQFIKFCQTDLETEQAEDKRIHNILFTIVIGLIISFIAIKFF